MVAYKLILPSLHFDVDSDKSTSPEVGIVPASLETVDPFAGSDVVIFKPGTTDSVWIQVCNKPFSHLYSSSIMNSVLVEMSSSMHARSNLRFLPRLRDSLNVCFCGRFLIGAVLGIS